MCLIMSEFCMNDVWGLSGFRLDYVSDMTDNMVRISDHMFAFNDYMVHLILHVNCPVCTCVQYVVRSLWLLISVPWLCVYHIHLQFPLASIGTKNSIKGNLNKSAYTGKDKGGKDITHTSNARDHEENAQKHCNSRWTMMQASCMSQRAIPRPTSWRRSRWKDGSLRLKVAA